MKNTMKRILLSLTATALVTIVATSGYAASLADGKTLYNTNCAGCHGALASSKWLGATPLMILTGISNVPGMSKLGTLTADQILSVSIALESSPTSISIPVQIPKPISVPARVDGAALYNINCQGCHNALASSNKKGGTAAQIQSAINADSGGMGSIQLTGPQITAIVSALKSAPTLTPTPTPLPPAPGDGVSLYKANCAICHGVLASSKVARVSSGDIQNAITANKGGMRSIKLTKAQLAYIAVALSTGFSGDSSGGKVDDGATVDSFSSQQCAMCHYSNGKVKPFAGTMPGQGVSHSGIGEGSVD
jgi:mono/diheme cytochrome c family protein